MSYTVVIKRTGEVYELSDEEGFELKAQRAEATKPFVVELGEDQYTSTDIGPIKKNKVMYSDIPNFEQKTLPSGPQCRGQFSIEREINNIIKDEGPGWAKNIRSKVYREKLRQKLRDQKGVDWCDYKASECACE